MKKAHAIIEYGLILALVAVIATITLGKFSETVTKADAANQSTTSHTEISNK